MACFKSELDLFRPRPMQTDVLNTFEVVYKPLASLENSSTIEFASLANNDQYRDLSSIYIRMRVKLFKDEKDTEHTDATVGPINNVMHSLIRQCSVYLNGTPVQKVDSNYAYRSYLENVLSYSPDMAICHLDGVGFSFDTPGEMDDVVGTKNTGLKARQDMFGKSKEVELVGRLHADMLNQPKLLINNVDLRIVLTLEKPEFYMMGTATDTSYIKILDCNLYMNHVVVSDDVRLAHLNVLKSRPCLYEYSRVECKSYTIAKDSQSISLDNIISGVIPNVMLICMTTNDAYNGNRTLNGFNFAHHDISSFCITLNGTNIPSQPIEFDFTDPKQPISARGYDRLFRGSNLHLMDRSMQVTSKFFNSGGMIFAYDLTPDKLYQKSHCTQPLRRGIVNIEARFAKALPKTLTVIVYAEYDAAIEINSDYAVTVVK